MYTYLVEYAMTGERMHESTLNADSWFQAMKRALHPDPEENIAWPDVVYVQVERLA